MIAYCDSSILVSAADEDEAHHKASQRCLSGKTVCSNLHGLAECFAVLSGRKGFTPEQAAQVIDTYLVRLTLVPLEKEDYAQTIAQAQKNGVRGGAIYDALHLAAARKVKADRIYTLNVNHFRLYAKELAARVTPP
jgi:predicted nucleic acid-binding protein